MRLGYDVAAGTAVCADRSVLANFDVTTEFDLEAFAELADGSWTAQSGVLNAADLNPYSFTPDAKAIGDHGVDVLNS